MRAHSTSALFLALLLSLPACGDDDDTVAPDAPGQADARPADARPADAPPADAPMADAGVMYDFGCLGMAFPTTAVDPIMSNGVIADAYDMALLDAVAMEWFKTSDDMSVATATTNAMGQYAASITTGATPFQGYVRLMKANYLPQYTYPPTPWATSPQTHVHGMVSVATAATLAGALMVTLDPADGHALVIVEDCDGTPVEGATVTVTPTPDRLVYLDAGGSLPTMGTMTTASGRALAINVAVGTVDITVQHAGHMYRAWPVKTRASSLTVNYRRP